MKKKRKKKTLLAGVGHNAEVLFLYLNNYEKVFPSAVIVFAFYCLALLANGRFLKALGYCCHNGRA